jgi:SsrA-binding protein
MATDYPKSVNIKNKKASFEFHLLDKYIAGLILTGTEIKSVRMGKASVQEAYCAFINGELFVKDMNISIYEQGTHANHEPKRQRKLLLNRKELDKLEGKMKEKGLTIIPLRLFVNERGLAKLEISLAKGKKVYDKREDIKQKDMKRELSRMKI